MRLPKTALLFRKVTLFVVASGLSLLCAEIAVRVFGIGPEIAPVYASNYRLASNPVLRYELVPGSVDGSEAINSHGMRDREYARDKPPGTIRIACIGDSICYGFNVRQSEAFSAHLEELLGSVGNDSGLTFEVLNFGVTGYSFTQIMENLRAKVANFEPDLIVYAYCLNDPQEYSLEMESLLAELTNAERHFVGRDTESGRPWIHRSRLFLLGKYAVESATREGKSKHPAPRPFEDDQQLVAIRHGTYAEYYTRIHASPETWKPVEDGLHELAKWSRDSRIPVQVTLFPVLRNLRDYPLYDLHADLERTFRDHLFSTLDLVDSYREYEAETGRRLGMTLHPDAEGHRLTAVAMIYDLAEAGLLPGLDVRRVGPRLDKLPKFRVVHDIVKRVRGDGTATTPMSTP